MTWDPPLLFGNFSVVARWFPGEAARVRTSTGFIGLDSPSNEASITMGFHGLGWLGGNGEGPHRYQHGIYADVARRAMAAGPRTLRWVGSTAAAHGMGTLDCTAPFGGEVQLVHAAHRGTLHSLWDCTGGSPTPAWVALMQQLYILF